MIRDGREISSGSVVECEICIVGAGAAGITIASELASSRLSVCLLESGGLEFEDETQRLYEGENVGFPYYDLRALRLRYFGGTTNHWSGWSRPLDPVDFEQRVGVPRSGWPLTRKDLDPYYSRAHELVGVGEYDYDVERWAGDPQAVFNVPGGDFTTGLMRKHPQRFGKIYRQQLDTSKNVDVLLHSNAVEFVPTENGESVRSVHVKTLAATDFSVRARVYVLATGAIENARLLLASNAVQSAGIGNGRDLVGRHFMEHLMVPGAMFMPADRDRSLELYRLRNVKGVDGQCFLHTTGDFLRRNGLLNTRMLLMSGDAKELALKNSDGVSSATLLWSAVNSRRSPGSIGTHLSNLISDIDKIAIYSFRRAFREPAQPVALLHQMEQAPVPESRVMLGEERDALGVPRVKLDWRIGELERRTLQEVNQALSAQLGMAGLGRLQIVENAPDGSGWPLGLRGSWHQMGTTKMGDSPSDSVVDVNCRVHEMDNIFVAGSSVFATSGTTNPTLTIVALAARLAEHIRKMPNSGGAT